MNFSLKVMYHASRASDSLVNSLSSSNLETMHQRYILNAFIASSVGLIQLCQKGYLFQSTAGSL